ncbi:MAG: hypothetical protein ACRDVL_09775, partial [Acidimicrobiia bacterium]
MRRFLEWLPMVALSACIGSAAQPGTTALTSTSATVTSITVSTSTTQPSATSTTIDPASLMTQLFDDRLPSRVVVVLTDSV